MSRAELSLRAHPHNPASDLAGRVVIITGAGQGIGRVYAQRFAQAGASVVIAEMNAESGDRVAADISDAGGKALAIATDVSKPEQVQAMADRALRSYGRIDALINNAAIYSRITRATFDQIPLEEWDAVLQTNVTGAFLCARAVTPAMKAAGFGRIINISSGTVTMGRPNFAHYVTSKAAIIGLTRVMARELGPFGINVNTIVPGLTRTEIEADGANESVWNTIIERQCIKRAGSADDLAEVALFLASSASDFVTGQSIAVDGGATHL